MTDYGKNSAELESEVEAQRQRVESRIDELRDRLSPGQLVDELLSYTRNGGQSFLTNLGNTIAHNPMPTALLGVSLVWLMSGQGVRLMGEPTQRRSTSRAEESGMDWAETDFPYATISGGLRRVSHSADASGEWTSEFEDTAGGRYRAKSNAEGHRRGHFIDNTGRMIGAFIDEAGHRIRDFSDEAGNRFADAAGWATHRWQDLTSGIGQAAHDLTGRGQHLSSQMGSGASAARQRVGDLYTDLPLVGGALAFAMGAALGATLPRTREEDMMVGKLGDSLRDRAFDAADKLYEEGKAKAGEIYDKGKEQVDRAYRDVTGTPGSGTGSILH